MSGDLLQTKLYVPKIRPSLVPRLRLKDRLNQGLQLGHKLTLVSAPAGFGKTTLIADFGMRISEYVTPQSEIRNPSAKPVLSLPEGSVQIPKFCWLSLDEGDNDPARFLDYFITALKQIEKTSSELAKGASPELAEGTETTIGKGTLTMLQSPQPPPAEVVLTPLINEIAAISDQIIFVLDDYHVIESSRVDDILAFLLENMPPQMHLIIATRVDPHLPLSRLRASGQMTELRASDLRFTSAEATEFLNRVMGLGLSPEDIAALETRTEGWIAGLQLAALSLQKHADTSKLIQSFTGSNRLVLDYLIEEVLNQQPQGVQDFLLQTAVLNRLTGPLCDAVCSVGTAPVGQEGSQQTLEMLERANLFVVPLDDERRWYRYHHLFADLLQQRLRQKQPDWIPMLHRQASEWYELNGFVDEAVEHALRAEDFERVASLLEKHVDEIWQRGEHVKLRRWQAALPAQLLCSKPRLCILHAWYLFTSGHLDAAEQSLQEAERALDPSIEQTTEISPLEQNLLPDTDRMKLRGRLAAVRAFIASYREDVQGTIQYARQALDYLPEQDLTWRSSAAIALGDAYGIQGDTTAAYQTRLKAAQTSIAAGDIYLAMIAHLKLAVTLRMKGQLQRVIEICRQQLQLANESGMSHIVVVGWLLAIWGEALAEMNDLDEAISRVRRSVELTEQSGDVAMLGWSYLCLTRVLFSIGDLVGAREAIYKIENLARESNVPAYITNLMAAWRARIWLGQDKLDAASQWVEECRLDADGEPTILHEMEYLALTRVLIAQRRLDQTTGLLQRLRKASEAEGRISRVIEAQMLQTLVYHAQGETDQAVTTLEQALTLAESAGFIRIFVDEGQPMARLLYEALTRGIVPDYTRRLLAAFPAVEPEQSALSQSAIHNSQPVLNKAERSEFLEPLSDRELEVLHLIAEGLTNPEIASKLYLSLNTVKVHTRNIYSKLDAHNRTQAVSKARTLGILPIP